MRVEGARVMTEATCPACHGQVSGIGTPSGMHRKRRGPAPEGSTGYCVTCHIALQKDDGAWRRL